MKPDSDPAETDSTDSPPAPADVRPTLRTLRTLRVWPALTFVALMVVLRLLPDLLNEPSPAIQMIGAMGPLLCSLSILIWWLAASRAAARERVLGLLGIVLAVAGTLAAADPSMRGPATMMWTIPMGMIGFTLGTLVGRNRLTMNRSVVAVTLAIAGIGISAFLRSDGMWGNMVVDLHWRWTPTAEAKMLAKRTAAKPPGTPERSIAESELQSALANTEWPGFRGPNRDSRQFGQTFSTNWTATPPELIWKIDVGPAWSSFAIAGNLLFTQEQRGPHETVVCYDADTGAELWTQQIEARFTEPLGGPGPRATPQISGNALFALGATGELLRINPIDGAVVWRENIGTVADRKPPTWGFSSSPLIVDGHVIVHAGGKGDKGILAFAAETGALQWSAPAGDHSYASPQPATIAGEEVVMMLTNDGMRLLEPATGKVRHTYEWKQRGYRALQPQVIDKDSVIISSEQGVRRIRFTKQDDVFVAEEIWSSRNMKSDFNDFVVHEQNLFGFDGGIFASVDLETGERNWKGGRYGKGQVLLLADSGLLLVAGERGQGVLLAATSRDHEELASFQMLKGKTWNHPIVVGDRLYLRNAQEAACYRLP